MSSARIQFLSPIKSITSCQEIFMNEILKASRIPRRFRVPPIPTTSIKSCIRGALPRRNNAFLLFTLDIVKFKVRSRAGASIHEKAIDQRSLMFSTCHDQKVPTKDFCPSVRHITDTKNPCVLVLTRCHVTDINHVLTPCHLIEINYVDRGVAARTPLQLFRCCDAAICGYR